MQRMSRMQIDCPLVCGWHRRKKSDFTLCCVPYKYMYKNITKLYLGIGPKRMRSAMKNPLRAIVKENVFEAISSEKGHQGILLPGRHVSNTTWKGHCYQGKGKGIETHSTRDSRTAQVHGDGDSLLHAGDLSFIWSHELHRWTESMDCHGISIAQRSLSSEFLRIGTNYSGRTTKCLGVFKIFSKLNS